MGMNATAIPAADELNTAFRKDPISDPNCATLYDLRSQAAAVDQSPHSPFNGQFLHMGAGLAQPRTAENDLTDAKLLFDEMI